MDRPAAFDAFFVQLLKLFSSDSTRGASTLASAAVDASVCVHRSNTINGDSANRFDAYLTFDKDFRIVYGFPPRTDKPKGKERRR